MSQDSNGKYNVNKENVATGGYDVVAYFTENAALRGTQKPEALNNV